MYKIKLIAQQYLSKLRTNKIKDRVSRQATHSSLLWTVSSMFLKAFILIFFGMLIMLPFIYMISLALMSNLEVEQLALDFRFFPEKAIWSNFTLAFESGYMKAFFITLSITVVSIILRIFVTATMGYAFAFKKWWGKKFLWLFFISLMTLPEVALLLNQYKIAVQLKLTGADGIGVYIGMILPYIAAVMSGFMFKDAFEAIPDRIKEATLIDGSNGVRYFFKIALPMVKPTIWTVGILTAFASWNAYMWPSLLIAGNSTGQDTLSTWLFNTGKVFDESGSARVYNNIRMAASILVTAPTIIVYLLFRRRIMDAVGKRGSTVKG